MLLWPLRADVAEGGEVKEEVVVGEDASALGTQLWLPVQHRKPS